LGDLAQNPYTRCADLRTRRQGQSRRSAQISVSFGNTAKAASQVHSYIDSKASRSPLVTRRLEMLPGNALGEWGHGFAGHAGFGGHGGGGGGRR
jgi:hypothetical protein